MGAPLRHVASDRNRRKALKFARDLYEEIEHIDNIMRKLRDEHLCYALGRAARLVNRLEAEAWEQHKPLLNNGR